MHLTFAMGYGRDAAYREQVRRRSVALVSTLPDSPSPMPKAPGFDVSPTSKRKGDAADLSAALGIGPTARDAAASPSTLRTAAAGMQTSTSHVDLRDVDVATMREPPLRRVVVDDDEQVDCASVSCMNDAFSTGIIFGECSGCHDRLADMLVTDGLCQWDIDQSGEGEVYCLAAHV